MENPARDAPPVGAPSHQVLNEIIAAAVTSGEATQIGIVMNTQTVHEVGPRYENTQTAPARHQTYRQLITAAVALPVVVVALVLMFRCVTDNRPDFLTYIVPLLVVAIAAVAGAPAIEAVSELAKNSK